MSTTRKMKDLEVSPISCTKTQSFYLNTTSSHTPLSSRSPAKEGLHKLKGVEEGLGAWNLVGGVADDCDFLKGCGEGHLGSFRVNL